MLLCFFFFFKQKTAYEMRISDWSSDVCSSDLEANVPFREAHHITGRAVKLAETDGTPLADLPLDKLQAIDSRIDGRIFGVLTVDASVGSRKSHGGTSPDRVNERIKAARAEPGMGG